ncbi:hypothetical protein FRC20_001160 [Serendipita sp. 405]|nr:hypothetical protein FRC20_001160 [Serendipita sp. 405]
MSHTHKVVICGAGFIGSYIARAFAAATPGVHIVLASRNPGKLETNLSKSVDATVSASSMDVTNIASVRSVMKDALQWKGAENVATAAQEVGAKVIHFSAIGADPSSPLVSPRTKGLGEQAVLNVSPAATIIRPSLVFGPGDSFFSRFATLSRFLPFMPVFGGGASRFQPIYVGDLARLVELCSHTERSEVKRLVEGKILEAGGPDVFTYKEIMQLVLKYTGRWRPIISAPFWVGNIQGAIFEQLPENILSISRDQISQLKLDNIVADKGQEKLVTELLQMQGDGPRKSVHDVLPSYL